MTIRVDQPEISERADMLELSARVASEAFPPGVPERLSWLIGRESGLAFSNRSDALLVAMLPIAMKLGQDIEIDGEISTRLAHGSESYQDILCAWWPDTFRRVRVTASTVNPRKTDTRPDGVGCSFSGGVDSYAAVMDLRPPVNRYPEFGITHALMINGYGQFLDLDRTGISEQMHRVYANALSQWGVRLVMIQTNLKLFRGRVFKRRELAHSFGASISACAHALAPVFGRFNIPGFATYRYEDLEPEGCHPVLDHHLSSDQLQIIHLGGSMSRSQKIERMASEAPVRQSLFACFSPPAFAADNGDVLNCCRCEKCFRTIVALDIIGQLGNFPTFRQRVDIRAYKDPRVLLKIPELFLRDLIVEAQRHRRDDWLQPLRTAEALKQSTAGNSASHALPQ